jgi:hypothetical protein
MATWGDGEFIVEIGLLMLLNIYNGPVLYLNANIRLG